MLVLPISTALTDGSSLTVHFAMFLPALMNLTTPEQAAEWLPQAMDFKIIGTYAQTELGHGTFVSGLETTATFDEERSEFVIHSPTITAYKVGRMILESIPRSALESRDLICLEPLPPPDFESRNSSSWTLDFPLANEI